MKTFSQILEDTAPVFLVPALGVEQIVYLKATGEGINAGDLKKMATIGVLTGRPGAMAAVGVLERRKWFGERQILALVNRQPIAGPEGAPHGHGPRLTVKVLNDSISGISSAEVDEGRDKIQCAVVLEEEAQELRITKILSHDAGMMTLEVGV